MSAEIAEWPEEKLDFFIAGAQKAGTTALDFFLRRHPGIQMAFGKEVHHFDDEAMDWRAPGHARLHGQFDWRVSGVLRGEATPIYMYWPNAMERLREYHAGAKLIVCLRHPSLRAYSHWRMETKRGFDTLGFEEAIRDTGRVGKAHRVYSYVERGAYAGQIERILRLFPRAQVHFLRTDALWAEPERVLGEVQDFLGVARAVGGGQEYVVSVDSSGMGEMPGDAREFLDRHYAADIRATAALSGLDLSGWLEPDYREPMGR